MAQIGFKTLTNADWEDAEVLFGITLEDTKKYVLQARNNVLVCPKKEKPTEEYEGFVVNMGSDYPVYTHFAGLKLWVKPINGSAELNIGD